MNCPLTGLSTICQELTLTLTPAMPTRCCRKTSRLCLHASSSLQFDCPCMCHNQLDLGTVTTETERQVFNNPLLTLYLKS